MIDLSILRKDIERDEGRVSHLYLCSAGCVTVGVGCRVFSVQEALSLPLEPHDAILSDYEAVKASKPGMLPRYYAAITRARMSDSAIDALLDARILEFVAQIRARIRNFDGYPDGPQRGLINIGFNCGIGGLLKFKNLLAACEAGDWERAAKESKRKPPISDERNRETAEMFLSATDRA